MAGPGADKPNIRQVADLAGVSHMTVSRVLNGHPHIREATRRRVQEAIETLDYRPNVAARALASQRSRRIGVLVETAATFGPTSTLHAVESAARAAGYEVSSVLLRAGEEISPQEAVDHLIGLGVDALCVVAPRSSSWRLDSTGALQGRSRETVVPRSHSIAMLLSRVLPVGAKRCGRCEEERRAASGDFLGTCPELLVVLSEARLTGTGVSAASWWSMCRLGPTSPRRSRSVWLAIP
jgi:hypothetical protein